VKLMCIVSWPSSGKDVGPASCTGMLHLDSASQFQPRPRDRASREFLDQVTFVFQPTARCNSQCMTRRLVQDAISEGRRAGKEVGPAS
jgi:hypothetical protein